MPAENHAPSGLSWKNHSNRTGDEPGRGCGTSGQAAWRGTGTSRLPARRSTVGSKTADQIDLRFCGRTYARRVMSFAPGEGASETSFMFPRLPVVPRYSRARMPSMARSNFRIARLRQEVYRENAPRRAQLLVSTHQINRGLHEGLSGCARTPRFLSSHGNSRTGTRRSLANSGKAK